MGDIRSYISRSRLGLSFKLWFLAELVVYQGLCLHIYIIGTSSQMFGFFAVHAAQKSPMIYVI